MYAAGFSLLGAQYTLADTVGFTITNMDGVPIKSALHGFIKTGELNEKTQNIKCKDIFQTYVLFLKTRSEQSFSV